MKVEMNIKRTYKYCIVLACAIIMFSFLLSPLTLKAQERPKVAVVLSGGGAKGVAHISALRAIEEAGLPIDIICGTSMGALVGGLYSIGWSVDELDSIVRHQEWSILLTDRIRPEELDIDTRRLLSTYPLWHAFSLGGKRNEGAGFVRGFNLDHLLDHLLEGYLDSIDFNTLPIPFACVATDIVSNTEIDFHSGYLKQALRASMSIPGAFSPVRMGNMLLVDGCMRNNYPADIARQMGADIIIGVTVQDDTLSADDITSPADLIMQIIDINTKNKYRTNLAMSDILMQVNVNGYSGASFTDKAIDTLLRRGAEAAALHRDELHDLQKRLGVKATPRTKHIQNDLTPDDNNFKLTALNPMLSKPIAGVTFRFDNEETGALQIGVIYPYSWHIPMELNARLRLGNRLHFSLENMSYPQGFTSPSIAYAFQRNDIDIYDKGVRIYNIKYSQHIVQFTPFNSRFRLYKIRAGLRFDYYDYYDPILSSSATSIPLNDHRFLSYFFQSLLDTEDDYYFPTSGLHFLVNFSYHTDNFATLDDKAGIPDFSLLWRINLSPSSKITFQPGLFSRMLLSNQMPLAYINVLGTKQEIVEQQIAFPGIHSLVQTERFLIGIHLNLQYMLVNKHYLLIRSAAARHTGEWKDFFQNTVDPTNSQYIYGLSLGYAYKSFLGPIEAHIGYSTLAPGLNFYLNIGHSF